MKKMLLSAAISSALIMNIAFAATPTQSKQLKDIAPYPTPTQDSNRHVIWLAEHHDESLYKVEVLATKTGMKDCNKVWYGGNFQKKL